ncbi:unnamed protein product [Trifolium pratense]|uniref:Uncharacterized protein n=1 Tax=Trifolium pratense TaxID=57577 RepID=A0ACB0JKL3_TRIPR|nr:unnamed protein product [Trifolium pratense]
MMFSNFDSAIFFSAFVHAIVLGLFHEYVGFGASGGGCYGGSGGGRKHGYWYGGGEEAEFGSRYCGRKEESDHEQNFELKILSF